MFQGKTLTTHDSNPITDLLLNFFFFNEGVLDAIFSDFPTSDRKAERISENVSVSVARADAVLFCPRGGGWRILTRPTTATATTARGAGGVDTFARADRQQQPQPQMRGQIVISTPGYLTSPNYPANYPLSQVCEWLVRSPEKDQRILINFNPHFDLEDRDCKFDYIEVYDGESDRSPPLLKHCGKIAPPPIHSTTHQVFIRFVSDYETSGAGFSVRYEINKLAHAECSSNLTAPSGVIRSPGYPDKYPNNLACVYTINPPSGEEIQVVFHSFSLEADTAPPAGVTCRYDWLEIWDGYPLVGVFLGRFCGDFNPGRIVSHSGVLTIVFTTDTAISKEGFEAQYTIRKRKYAGTCSEPLGMESGDITSSQIRAKSQYNPSWAPERSRLNYPENGWTPSEDSSKEWIEVDLGFLKYVTAIGVQGAVSKETKKSYFVKTFRVSLSTNGEDWIPVKEDGRHKEFVGNSNPVDEVRRSLPRPMLTRYLRIRPMSWHNGICMRFEVYGCRLSDPPCSSLLGMISGVITDLQIHVHPPPHERSWMPDSVRLVTGRNGWALPSSPGGLGLQLPDLQDGDPHHPPSSAPYVQLDLGQDRLVTALVLQGGRLREKPVWVKRFRAAWRAEGGRPGALEPWRFYTEGEDVGSQPKIFPGNQNHDTPEVRELSPQTVRYLRVYPERGSPDGLALRLEVLGCSPPGDDSPGTDLEGEDVFTMPEFLWFSCDFGYGLSPSHCAWSQDTEASDWLFHNTQQQQAPPLFPHLPNQEHSGSHGIFIYPSSSSSETTEHREKEGERERKREKEISRLISPTITAPVTSLCLSFYFYYDITERSRTEPYKGSRTHEGSETEPQKGEGSIPELSGSRKRSGISTSSSSTTKPSREHSGMSPPQRHSDNNEKNNVTWKTFLRLKLRKLVREVDETSEKTTSEKTEREKEREREREKERDGEILLWEIMDEERERERWREERREGEREREEDGEMDEKSWREGRVLLPPSQNISYQVMFEGSGWVALDDIKILDNLDPTECQRSSRRTLESSGTSDRTSDRSETLDRTLDTSLEHSRPNRTSDNSLESSRTSESSLNPSRTLDSSLETSRTLDGSSNSSGTSESLLNPSRTLDSSLKPSTTNKTFGRSPDSYTTSESSLEPSRTLDSSLERSRANRTLDTSGSQGSRPDKTLDSSRRTDSSSGSPSDRIPDGSRTNSSGSVGSRHDGSRPDSSGTSDSSIDPSKRFNSSVDLSKSSDGSIDLSRGSDTFADNSRTVQGSDANSETSGSLPGPPEGSLTTDGTSESSGSGEPEGSSTATKTKTTTAVLRTLDPILITIIAMSALGVVMGTVCGVLLYCVCGTEPEPDENRDQNQDFQKNQKVIHHYNFELVKSTKKNLKNLKSEGQRDLTEV
ncbi:hypothetical protein ACEWY4_027636 [Coilia grayii]|uniref:Neuropilin n=1 Tax=Coilia grayii TaxID=363190 RepID=A0ABD1IPN2_9TELE